MRLPNSTEFYCTISVVFVLAAMFTVGMGVADWLCPGQQTAYCELMGMGCK